MINLLDPVLSHLDATTEDALKRVFALMEIPSISTDPAYNDDCQKAADYCSKLLEDIGFTAQVHLTDGQPMVLGKYKSKAGDKVPHILFYGHYDVQPADPLELWDTPPFSPQIKQHEKYGDVIVGRGSSDDKGQLMTFIEACYAWQAVHGELPLDITILLEGEEESGSPSLEPFLAAHKDDLRADLALVCDTGQWSHDTPAITTMLRGLAFTELTITGPNRDLHSGLYGGIVMNPIRVLTDILGDLYDDQGVIQIPGFYDDIDPPSQEQIAQWKSIGFSDTEFLGGIGLTEPAGERAYSGLEQLWSRPTVEVNGICGGYIGPGSKTVIPSSAFAKISFRLVANQDPHKVLENLKVFVESRLPKDCKAEFSGSHGSPAVKFDQTTQPIQFASQALAEEFGKQTVLMGCGASIPIVESFKNELGMETMLIGFALEDDQIHAPNEKYNLTSFTHGKRAWARIIDKLSKL